jgi:hypothetical protein
MTVLTKSTLKLLTDMCADHVLEEKVRGWSSWSIRDYIPQRRHVKALRDAGFIDRTGSGTDYAYYNFFYWTPTDAGRAYVAAINAPQESTT